MTFLPDDVLANVLSRLPGMEIARLRPVSRQFLHVSEDYYRKLTLPTAMNVKLQFNKEVWLFKRYLQREYRAFPHF